MIIFLIGLILIPFVEYLVHRYSMHRLLWPFKGTFERHAICHHKLERVDINVDMPWYIPVVGGSPWLVLLLITNNAGWAFIWILVCLFYAHYWTKMHRLIHELEVNWVVFAPFTIETFLHHKAHHENPTKNFGTVFIFTDYLFGTKI